MKLNSTPGTLPCFTRVCPACVSAQAMSYVLSSLNNDRTTGLCGHRSRVRSATERDREAVLGGSFWTERGPRFEAGTCYTGESVVVWDLFSTK